MEAVYFEMAHLFVEVHHGLSPVPLGGVEGVDVVGVGPQLLHGPGTEGVTSGDQNSEVVLHQPKSHLKQQQL